jgi:hypothetical protein
VLSLDIETAPNIVYTWGLRNQFITIDQIIESTRMLSFAAKWHGTPAKDTLFYSEFHDGTGPMRDAVHALLDEADIVVHFNGISFDIPKIRGELALGQYKPFSPIRQVDLCKVAQKQFGFVSNKLDYLLQTFGLGHKVKHTGFSLWVNCLAGDEKAWELMKKYNIGDVVKTEKLYDHLLPWIPNHPHVGLWADDDREHCSNCGRTRLERRGFAYTTLGKYPRYVCKDCGKWGRGKKASALLDIRSAS